MQVKSVFEKRVAALRAAMIMKQAESLLKRGFATQRLEDFRKFHAMSEDLRQRAVAVLQEVFQVTHFTASMFLYNTSIQEVQRGILP